MKCPILEIGWMQTKVGDLGVSPDCLKEECAWWDEEDKQCAVLSLITEFAIFNLTLLAGVEKMPSPEFFKK